MRMDQRDTGPESLQRVRNDLHAWDYHQEMCANLVFWLRIKMDPNTESSRANQWSCFCLVKTWRLLHVYNHLGALVLPLGSTRNPGYTGYIAVGVQKCMWNTIKKLCVFIGWLCGSPQRQHYFPLTHFKEVAPSHLNWNHLKSTWLQVAGPCVVVVVVLPTSPPCLVVDTVVETTWHAASWPTASWPTAINYAQPYTCFRIHCTFHSYLVNLCL